MAETSNDTFHHNNSVIIFQTGRLARPDRSGRWFVPSRALYFPWISAAHEQAGLAAANMVKQDEESWSRHVTPANQSFPLYSCKQRSTFCTWNSWSSSRPDLLPSPRATKDCCSDAGTPSLSPKSELLPRQGDKNYYHCIIERISRHIVSCGD